MKTVGIILSVLLGLLSLLSMIINIPFGIFMLLLTVFVFYRFVIYKPIVYVPGEKYLIKYLDRNLKATKREIKVIEDQGDKLLAYCYLRKDERTFYKHSILKAIKSDEI